MSKPSTACFTKSGCTDDIWDLEGSFTGAGAAVPTKVRGNGILPMTRQGVGQYTMFFTDVGGLVARFRGIVHTAATVAPMEAKMVAGSLNTTTKSIQIEFWSLVATPALADPPASSFVDVTLSFYKNIAGP